MELHQVRYFVTLARTLNFTRAAADCNVTQPALTRAIQKLEDELGGTLLFRERGLTQLTELGQAMLPHLRTMLGAAETARRLAGDLLGRQDAQLRLGLGPAIAAARVAETLTRLARAFPALAVSFAEDDTPGLTDAMLGGTLDCALLPEAPDLPERLHRWKLGEEGCAVVLPAAHSLAARETLTAEDLDGETLLLGERCGGFALRLLAETQGGCALRHCGGSWVQMLDLVGAGLGVALLPDALPLGPGLVARRLAAPELRRGVVLALAAGRPLGGAAAQFVKLCRAREMA
ncbi:MAG: LysR family transcriptional regulator [Rhodospirillales bacterium]|nr:LysR family transcriptional regulator [Rhodospirillales bacterium]